MQTGWILCRYSIWLDSKLRLQSDPLLILEYFLWRKGHEYAISNHYDRHCVWEEVAQNKKLNKFNHTIIDQQFEFYQSDGLKRFDSSDPNRLLSSRMYIPWFITIIVLCKESMLVWTSIFSTSIYRCSRRIIYYESTYTNVKPIFLPLVQWSGAFYSKGPAEFCLYIS